MQVSFFVLLLFHFMVEYFIYSNSKHSLFKLNSINLDKVLEEASLLLCLNNDWEQMSSPTLCGRFGHNTTLWDQYDFVNVIQETNKWTTAK